MEGRPRRSVLYMPGSNERALEKAKTLPADALILDLEDAVAPDEKIRARQQVCAVVKGGGYGAREVVIRVNALETPWGTEDILAACDAEPDAILVPKVVHAGDIVSVAKILQGVHAPDKIRLWAMMETPMAILNARTIAATAVYAENRLCCLVMGTNDLIKESRARALHDRFAVVPFGLFHICFKLYSFILASFGVMVAHFTPAPYFLIAFAASTVILSSVSSLFLSSRS
jgi:citrate lyase subunit beta/citryl-CoA lyase